MVTKERFAPGMLRAQHADEWRPEAARAIPGLVSP
jgi:hypothetical protein